MAATVIEKGQIEERTYTLEEYFELEDNTKYKNEFHNGKIVPMAGGTIAHNDISGNIYLLLRLLIKATSKNYRVFNSDQKIFIPIYKHIVYSDTFVVKDTLQTYQDGKQAILNPALIVEVSSESTASYDRRGKFRKYKTLDSFEEYVLIEQDTPIVDVLSKNKDGGWILNTYIGLDDTVHLQSIDIKINMLDIYENIDDLKDPQISIAF